MKTYIFFLVIFFFFLAQAKAQDIDQVKQLKASLKETLQDSVKAEIQLLLSEKLAVSESSESKKYAIEALSYFEKTGDEIRQAKAYSNIAFAYLNNSEFEQAIDFTLKALNIYEKINVKISISDLNRRLGGIYYYLENYEKSMDYFKEAMTISSEMNDKKTQASLLNNMGLIYEKWGKYDSALVNHQQSLKIREELDDKYGIAGSVSNIGNVFLYKEEYQKAINFYLKSVKIKEEINDKLGMTNTLQNIGFSYYKNKDYEIALEYVLKGLHIAKEIKNKHYIKEAYGKLADIYEVKKNYTEAFKYQKLYGLMKDTIFNEQSAKQMTEMETKYQTEKKEKEIIVLNQEKKIKDLEIISKNEQVKKQITIIYSFILGFILILVFSILLYRQFIAKKKAYIKLKFQNVEINQANEEITAQRDEIAAQRDLVTEQKEHIEEQKKEITDSIQYAKRIQTAVLPADKYADSILGEHFIIFRPHSVVSGDFYWATKVNEWLIVTAADCTGHGVPGAFMSMLGISFLNEIVRKKEVTNAADVLNNLRTSVIDALKQTGEEGTQKDGMDMSLAAINMVNKQCQWAGANNPLWIVRKGEVKSEKLKVESKEKGSKPDELSTLELDKLSTFELDKLSTFELDKLSTFKLDELKPDKMPVAVHVRMDNFTNHEIQLETGDKLYLFSDGLPDQFGGPKGKKFLTKQFKTILVETANLSMKEQGQFIEKELDNWMNWSEAEIDGVNFEGQKYEQIDDITVVGLKL